jgi:L-lactate dehydrogenase (cytochrome)
MQQYPSIEDLIKKAKQRIPRFAFEYLDGGCNEDINLIKNTQKLREVELNPFYLQNSGLPEITTQLFNKTYNAPFGIAPIGLQGLIWPNAPEILAKAAYENNIPFILSTVTTSSIERIATLTNGQAWFQLYHPANESLTNNILERCTNAGYNVLVLLADVPSFGYRPRDIRNGLAMPPKMSVKNLLQIAAKPQWAIHTLWHGKPQFATMKKYMPKHLNMQQLGMYMNQTFSGKLTIDKIKAIRDKWKGKLVIKGISTPEDTATAVALGIDGIIISNHGGRQLDAAEAAITSLQKIAPLYNNKISIMMDSGIRSGIDIARALASGASFVFLGRTFMYSVAALGNNGGNHAINILMAQLQQLMQQVNCTSIDNLQKHLVVK